MKLKVAYENEYQTIILDDNATEAMWVSLDLEDISTEASQEEKEELIQKAFDEQFNKPEYSNWRKHNRRVVDVVRTNDEGYREENSEQGIMEKALDDSAYTRAMDELEEKLSYEEWCQLIRKEFPEKTANMLIAVILDGCSLEEYAAFIGDKPNNISHRYCRALKKLKNIFPKRPILSSPVAI